MEAPRHVAVVMDGNGRWAKARGKPRMMGHRQGAKTAKNIIQWALRAGVEQLTLFAFGQENWQRPSIEVRALMELLERALLQEAESLQQQGVRLEIVGDVSALEPSLLHAIDTVVQACADNQKLLLTIAFSYSGQWHISDVVARCLHAKAQFKTVEALQQHLDSQLTIGQGHPDVLIRTGGEKRLSNFLLWQMAYTELFFLDVYWPDLTETLFLEVLSDYMQRQRRFGRIQDEVIDEV